MVFNYQKLERIIIRIPLNILQGGWGEGRYAVVWGDIVWYVVWYGVVRWVRGDMLVKGEEGSR